MIDVDNGTRATVRDADGRRVVIETDSCLVRELPVSYVQDHLEHAYALTGHAMQGGTIEHAIVLASPRELTAGWSYTALSRARGSTQLLIHERTEERSEFAPGVRERPSRMELLARVMRHMHERDDEELAIEQVGATVRKDEPDQLRSKIEHLRAQLAALPTRELERVQDLEARALRLTEQRERLAEGLTGAPEPRRRLARARDPAAVERARLSTVLRSVER